jgi:hypothetical protein
MEQSSTIVRNMKAKLAAACVVVVSTAIPLPGQAPGIPRGGDGKPDLSGIWQSLNAASWDLEDHTGALHTPPGQGVVEGGEIPYRPEAMKKKAENFAGREKYDLAEAACYMPGVPRAMYMPYPFEIIQTPKLIEMSFTFAHARRNIIADGSPHPDGFPDFWMGDSRGRWEGDTLVVDVTNLDERTWLDHAGNYHSDALHVVERYTMIDPTHIQYGATLEDPKVFAKPWKINMMLYKILDKNAKILEYECVYYIQDEKYGNAKPVGVSK